ncbi:MAG: hypothetical protein CMN95_08125 [Synechococcus sp. MED650]|nr:hypothetical protein [Synechococcus sp. MED650]OUW53487.1 MAG: hypothetical protein CBD48_06295 [Cyanobacteria bacterium TMED188]
MVRAILQKQLASMSVHWIRIRLSQYYSKIMVHYCVHLETKKRLKQFISKAFLGIRIIQLFCQIMQTC